MIKLINMHGKFKYSIVRNIVFLLLLFFFQGTMNLYANQNIKTNDQLTIVNLKGNYYTMGYQYGTKFKKDIFTFYNEFKALTDTLIGKMVHYYYNAIIDKRERHFIEGLSHALGLHYSDALDIDLIPIIALFNNSNKNINKTTKLALSLGNCSFLGAYGNFTKSGSTLIARNFDLNKDLSHIMKYSVLLVLHPNNGDQSVAIVSWLGAFYGFSVMTHNLFTSSNDASHSVHLLQILGGIDMGHRLVYAALSNHTFQNTVKQLQRVPAYLTSAIVGVTGHKQTVKIEAPATAAPHLIANKTALNYFTNLYEQNNYLGSRLSLSNCLSEEKWYPNFDTPSHSCTRNKNIVNYVTKNKALTINSLQKFFTTSIDSQGVYQSGTLQQYPSNSLTFYTIVGNVDTNDYWFRFYGKNWTHLNLKALFSH